MNLRQAAQQALEALTVAWQQNPHWQITESMRNLREALAEPEKQVAWNWMLDGLPHGPAYYGPPPDDHVAQIGLANGRSVRLLYAAPPQREHITDGSPCWCNPDVIEEDGGNVIVHNYEDNWQQYAKPGETAQQCIERHRAEQDALMKLYATPRKPLTDLEIFEMANQCTIAHDLHADKFARAIERAHGIGGGE